MAGRLIEHNGHASGPAAELWRLHEAGRLVADYPRVAGLVDQLTGADLARAGRQLARLDPEEILREHPATSVVSVGITGHGTLSALVPALTAQLARHRLLLRPVLTDFDSYAVQLLDPDSTLRRARPDLVLCVLDPTVIFDGLPVPWRPQDVAEAATERIGLIDRIAAAFDQAGHGSLVLNTLPLLRRHTAALVDHRSRAALGMVWREANIRLLGMAERYPSVVVLDLDPLLAQGVPASDDRLSVYARAHLTDELLTGYAVEVGHLVRQLTGRTKKCLVLDLDNTLWGGVLGDDGPAGIELGDGHRGEAFAEFQRVVKQLGAQGVLLAVVSKNEPELVRQALREHPRRVLTEDDFVAVMANWRPKHDNLRALADTLGLSPDGFVIVDDSIFERELVRRELPEVTVVAVDGEPAWHVRNLLRDGWFDVREVTADDRLRARRYHDETERRGFLDRFDSVEDYLRELRTQVRIQPVAETGAARISQLTLRTNQFNLTGTRLALPAVLELIRDPDTRPLGIHARDRFGDHGLVGAVLTRRDGDLLHIDNFLLSCRVLGRSIEQGCLSWVLRQARDSGVTAVVATYRATGRNHRVADFYPRHGFVSVRAGKDADADTVTFRHALVELPAAPRHIRLKAQEGELR